MPIVTRFGPGSETPGSTVYYPVVTDRNNNVIVSLRYRRTSSTEAECQQYVDRLVLEPGVFYLPKSDTRRWRIELAESDTGKMVAALGTIDPFSSLAECQKYIDEWFVKPKVNCLIHESHGMVDRDSSSYCAFCGWIVNANPTANEALTEVCVPRHDTIHGSKISVSDLAPNYVRVKLNLGDRIEVKGKEFILVEFKDELNEGSSVQFVQPVHFLREVDHG